MKLYLGTCKCVLTFMSYSSYATIKYFVNSKQKKYKANNTQIVKVNVIAGTVL